MNADKWTDKELARLEKRIAKEYEQAGYDLSKYYDNYINGWDEQKNGETIHHKGLYERRATEYEAYQAGKYHDPTGQYTDEEMFNRWWVAQEGRGQHYADMVTQMDERLQKAGTIAQDYANGILPKVWVNNNNAVANLAQASAMEQGVMGVRFDLVDEYTVKRLMQGSREARPYKPIALDLPKMSKYNRTKLQNTLLEGILAGDGIPKMADRFEKVSSMNRSSAVRNARTAVTGAQSAGKQARYEDLDSMGCKATKIWVATEDDRTRPEHADADGQEVDYDEPFDVGGEELMYPADPNGSDWNIYNCRCTTRAGKFRFSSVLSDRAKQIDTIEIENSQNTAEVKEDKKIELKATTKEMIQGLEKSNVAYNEVKEYTAQPTTEQIISKLGGGDMTAGSCSSLAFAYIGNANGLDVTDFRGGNSQSYFSRVSNIEKVFSIAEEQGTLLKDFNDFKMCNQLFKQMEIGAEYYLMAGRHASIVRKLESGLEYLELQSENRKGWQKFDGNPRYTLKTRFGCREKHTSYGCKLKSTCGMINVNNFKDNEDFKSILGYINTNTTEQKKGASGFAK